MGGAACTDSAPSQQDSEDAEDGFVVEDGKADDFLSLKAKEYIVTGVAKVVVENGKTIERARNLLPRKQEAITWFLNEYLHDKESGADGDANYGYGGFSAMVKDGDVEESTLTQVNAVTYSFNFTQTIAGKKNLLSKLPLNSRGEFTIEIGLPTNAQMEASPEWYREAPWDAWNPANVPAAQKETLTLKIVEDKTSTDGWWDYKRLIEDGQLTIDAHFGWDYSPQKMHLVDSKAFYTWLTGHGFHSPVSSFDKLTNRSAPLTKTISANGHDVKVAVRIYYPKPGSNTDPDTDAGGKVMEDDMFNSLKDRDVVVYSGHSGSLYGFALANWNKTDFGDVDDSELKTAQLATGKYQIVLAEGCNTYMLGHDLLANPSKNGKDIDVITTTSFSVSYSPVEDFIGHLLEMDSSSHLRPRTVSETLSVLDSYSVGEPSPTMYGIHGIDDNPKLHPFAKPENMCKSCSSNAACGGVGNACITVGDSGRRCTAACTSDDACGAGYKCKAVASASTSTIYGSYCVPASRSCE
jgi:hypothetical protein